MSYDYRGIDPSATRRFLCRLFESRYFWIRHAITLSLGALAALTRNVTVAFIFMTVLGLFIVLRLYIWLTSLKVFRRLFRPKRIIITSEGFWFILFSIAVGVAAVNTGISLLYLMFAMLPSLIVVSGILLELSFRKISVERILPPAVFCGEEFEAELLVHNGKRLMSAFSLSFEEVVEGGEELFEMKRIPYLVRVPPEGTETVRYTARAKRRGMLHLKGTVVASLYPFGFFHKRMSVEAEETLLVYPEIIPLNTELFSLTGKRHILRRVSPFTHGDEEFRGLKDYREGENPKHIHWPLSAKHNKLLVREMEKKRASRVLVVLDTTVPAGSESLWRFENAVSVAASVLYHSDTRGYETALALPLDGRLQTVQPATGRRHIFRMLEFLALVQPSDDSDKILSAIPVHLLRGATVFLVASAKRRTVFDTERALRRAGCSVRLLFGSRSRKEERELALCDA